MLTKPAYPKMLGTEYLQVDKKYVTSLWLEATPLSVSNSTGELKEYSMVHCVIVMQGLSAGIQYCIQAL